MVDGGGYLFQNETFCRALEPGIIPNKLILLINNILAQIVINKGNRIAAGLRERVSDVAKENTGPCWVFRKRSQQRALCPGTG
jgi:hypothetical protein